jgi:CheY-like chemotaxis protein
VDDDSAFLKATKQILEVNDAFQVDIASSTDEALDKLKRTEYDVVVSDYQMSGISKRAESQRKHRSLHPVHGEG